jgi:hypothetical protein
MKKILFCTLALISLSSFGQKNVFVTISPKFAGADLQMGVNYTSINGVVLNLDHFDYYLSDLHVIHDGGLDLDLSDTVFLVEPQNNILYLGFLNVTTIEQLNFAIGVPAVINTSAGPQAIDITLYPEGHPLSFQDPSMYWGWTAGYMHMIIGGLADSNTDGIADAEFEVHTVGDANYRHVQLPVIQSNTLTDIVNVALNCNVDYWIKDIPIETVGILHGSTGINMEIMKNVETEPVFTQPSTATTQELSDAKGSIYTIQNSTGTTISWSDINNVASFIVTDINGKLVQFGKAEGNKGAITVDEMNSGIYFFHLFDNEGKELKQLKFIK